MGDMTRKRGSDDPFPAGAVSEVTSDSHGPAHDPAVLEGEELSATEAFDAGEGEMPSWERLISVTPSAKKTRLSSAVR